MDERVLQFDYEWREGDREVAKELAREFVADHDELNPILGGYTREQLVQLVETYRDEGRHMDRLIADMWLMATFNPPKPITGQINVGAKAFIEALDLQLQLK